MQTFILILVASIALLTISLQRTYNKVPLRELKRRARAGDEFAVLLHRAAAYGPSLRVVLWFLIGVSNAAFFLLVSLYTPAWFALSISAALIWFGFVWLPARQVTRFGDWIAIKFAPFFGWILLYLHPLLSKLISLVKRLRPITVHTGLYDREDLLDLLEQQHVQVDNRIEKNEIEIAYHALTFGDILIREAMVPRRVVQTVSIDDTLGPVLMSELHQNGHSRFPVYESKKNNIVGTLFLRDVVKSKAGGRVKDIMRETVNYVHEDQSLAEALQAIIKTRHHLLVVVNSFEEYVGIITIEDVFEKIIGKPILDEFDQYDDLRAVAARDAKAEHEEHIEEETEEESEEEIKAEAPAEVEETTGETKPVEPEAETIQEREEPKPQKRTIKEEDIDDHIEID